MKILHTGLKSHILQQRFTQSTFHPVNSSTIIRNFQEFSKQNERKKILNKRQLQRQIKKTNYKIKIKKTRKNINLQKILENDNFYEGRKFNELMLDNKENEGREGSNFDQFISKKRIKNMNLKMKMRLFGNSISDRTKAEIQKQINMKTFKIEERKTVTNAQNFHISQKSEKITDVQPENQIQTDKDSETEYTKKPKTSSKDQQQLEKMKRFTICHMILDKMLGLMVQNPHFINLKYQNPQIFKNLKEQMLELLINNQKIKQSTCTLLTQMRTTSPSKFNFSKLKLKKLQMQRKPFYLLKKQKKDELTQQICQIMQSLKQMIEQALFNFDKPDIAYNLSQHWQHRQGYMLSTLSPTSWSRNKSINDDTITRLRYQ